MPKRFVVLTVMGVVVLGVAGYLVFARLSDLENQVAGLGRAAAFAMAREGAAVVLTGRDAAEGDAAAAEIRELGGRAGGAGGQQHHSGTQEQGGPTPSLPRRSTRRSTSTRVARSTATSPWRPPAGSWICPLP